MNKKSRGETLDPISHYLALENGKLTNENKNLKESKDRIMRENALLRREIRRNTETLNYVIQQNEGIQRALRNRREYSDSLIDIIRQLDERHEEMRRRIMRHNEDEFRYRRGEDMMRVIEVPNGLFEEELNVQRVLDFDESYDSDETVWDFSNL